MTDFEFDSSVVRMLDRYTRLPERSADWQDVLRRSGSVEPRRKRRTLLLAAALVAILTLGLATPLGGAIRRSVSDFSDWLAGTPGAPVSAEEQQAFDRANRKSWAGFPGSPQLWRLQRTEVDGIVYDVLGFRSTGSLCTRVVASGEAGGSTVHCAPVDELRHDDGPVRVLLADWTVGRGDKTAKVGFDTVHSARAQVTVGIAADGVTSVELVDDQGSHHVPVVSNAFIYVAERPEVGQRVTQIRARLDDGRTVDVPFSVAPWGPGPGAFGGGAGEPGGPEKVERVVEGGTIGWFTQREERGEPLDDELRETLMLVPKTAFGRMITPDPSSSKRMVITAGKHRHFPLRPTNEPWLSYFVVGRGGTSGSGIPLDDMFPRSPFTFTYGTVGGGDQFATFAGLASDDVARLEIFTATGERIPVPLRDNAYLIEVALARFPAKVVAYDAEGRVIGIERTHRSEGPATVVGGPILRLTATAPSASMTLLANRTKEGGECWFVNGTGAASVRTNSCTPKNWTEAQLRIGTAGEPLLFVYGRARSDITRIEVRYGDSTKHAFAPGRSGYILEKIPPRPATAGALSEIVGLDATGKVVSRQDFGGPAREPAEPGG
jgi:hypothetical protein